jgi:hypothetical protein
VRTLTATDGRDRRRQRPAPSAAPFSIADVIDAQTATVIVGTAGIVGTVVSGISQTALANRRHRGQLRHDRVVADRTALRDVLDDAAQTVRRAMWSTDEILVGFRAGNLGAIHAARTHATELAREAGLTSGRLALRLGREHAVSNAYERILDTYIAMTTELNARLPVGWRRYVLPRRRQIAEDLESIASRHETAFIAARRDFIDAAREIVGVSLLEP